MVCALNTSSETSFLDHISPLASLLDIPLIISDERNALLTAKYYPEVRMRYWPDLEFRLKELSEEFDTAISCDYWHPSVKTGLKRHIFCPHGQSDKGYSSPILAPYAVQEAVLLYGDLMKEMLIDLDLWRHIPRSAVIGNFRLAYYRKHQKRLMPKQSKNRTLLYAPTWKDLDGAGTFFELGKKIVEETPSDWHLIIKVHPLLEQRDPALFYRLSLFLDAKENVTMVDECPLIYPLLDKIDVYLGDYSSIGYDVLAFQKPMFFLKQPHLPPALLHSCGAILDPTKNVFQEIERLLASSSQFTKNQERLYQKAFASVNMEQNLKRLYE